MAVDVRLPQSVPPMTKLQTAGRTLWAKAWAEGAILDAPVPTCQIRCLWVVTKHTHWDVRLISLPGRLPQIMIALAAQFPRLSSGRDSIKYTVPIMIPGYLRMQEQSSDRLHVELRRLPHTVNI